MALIVKLAGYWAHYRVIGTNHTTCLTYPTPPRTALLGKIGAALGLTYQAVMTDLEPEIETGFAWTSPVVEEVIGHKRLNLEDKYWAGGKFKNIIKGMYGLRSGWENNKTLKIRPLDAGKFSTIDNLSYLRNKNPNERLTANWFINSKKYEERIYKALQKPIYPLCFGTAEALVRIVSVQKVDAKKVVDEEINTLSSVPSVKGAGKAYCSRLPRKAKGYKAGEDFVSVWTPVDGNINIVPAFGAYVVGKETYGVL